MRARALGIFGALFAILLLIGCGQDLKDEESSEASATSEEEEKESEEASTNQGDFEIDFTGEIVEADDKFIVEGETNLLPESRLVAEVLVSEDEVYSDTTELVDEDGSFYMELEHHQFGDAEIIVRFDFDGVQEDPIKRHYGEKGQNLEGPYIYKHDTWDGILKKAEVRVDYKANENNDLTLQAPAWNDLPNDYGDSRVWIEVDEITEDDEFFYIDGRSNILEGSEIKASYGGNSDKTSVLPDGSFHFKVDYEYLEDEDFVITFEPARWQWNEIEEAYGTEGQKLIGDLVETNKYNDKQHIEMHVPLESTEAGDSHRADEQRNDEADEEKVEEEVDQETDREESNEEEENESDDK